MPHSIIAHSAENLQESPFDSIRHFKKDGTEYWLARELMAILEYRQWRQFSEAIERAIACQENLGESCSMDFLRSIAKTKGRPKEDYELSRKACYLVAMNGDPRKSAIAQAQQYFAIKTREAEVIIPAQSDRLRELELVLAIEKEKNKGKEISNTLVALHGTSLALAIMGNENVVVREEIKTTEVVNPATNRRDDILSAPQLKEYIYSKTGVKIKSLNEVTRKLKKLNRDDLLVAVTRNNTSEYIPVEKLDEAIALLFGKQKIKQMLIGEAA